MDISEYREQCLNNINFEELAELKRIRRNNKQSATMSPFPLIYRLAGKTLTLNQHKIRLGLPESQFLTPYSHLYSRLVVIRGFDDPQPFLEAAQRQLNQRNITATLHLITKAKGEPIRRIINVKGKTLVGYGVKISALNEKDSISLQEQGIGGKHKMGCGVFTPFNPRQN